MTEVEIKCPIDDPDLVEKKLLEMGFHLEAVLLEEDRYLDNGDGMIRTNGQALRIRSITELSPDDGSIVNGK